jgi:hypothetical protein
MKSTTVGIEVWYLIPQQPCLIFSRSSQLGADAPIPFAKLQPSEVQEERRGAGESATAMIANTLTAAFTCDSKL